MRGRARGTAQPASTDPSGRAAQVPRLPRPGLVDARLLVVALAVSSPAIYRLAQGMVSVTDVLTRYLLVALGCVVTAALVRSAWPLLSGEPGDPVEPLREAIEAGLRAVPASTTGDTGGELDVPQSPGATGPSGELEDGLDPLFDAGLDGPSADTLGDDLLKLSEQSPA